MEPSGRWYSTGTPSTRYLWMTWLLATSDGESGRVSLRNASSRASAGTCGLSR